MNTTRNGLLVLLLAAGSLTVCETRSSEQNYTPSLTGPLGLNTIPNARMDEPGTLRIGTSTLDPYIHTYAGAQIAAPLYINLRQTAEVSDLWESADHLYPGLDFKLRLAREGSYTPEISIGAQSALGDKRMAGEYLALSKRLGDFDLTGGIGWGRFGSASHIPNPFRALGNHFSGKRNTDGEGKNQPSDWLSGDNVGLFGGVEYFTPIEGLSLKFDIGADNYAAERAAFNFDRTSPWSAGLSYSPARWINASLAVQGGEKIMGTLSLQTNVANWPLRDINTTQNSPRFALLGPEQNTENISRANLHLSPFASTPTQIGDAARTLNATSDTEAQALEFQLISLGLRGPAVRFMRSDFAKSTSEKKQGSPQEIWANTEFITIPENNKNNTSRFNKNTQHPILWLTQDNQFSLAEENTGLLYRSSLIANAQIPELLGIMTVGGAFRLNIANNLHRLNRTPHDTLLPVRSDVEEFADRAISLNQLYTTTTHSLSPEIHTSLSAGYLEEMYAGLGGEIIYRPFRSRFAIGAEIWEALKRDPYTTLNLGLSGDRVLTGHLNAWYDWPNPDITLFMRAGRNLDEDIGLVAGLEKDFENGAQLKGFISISSDSDLDNLGNPSHSFHGVSLTLPLGSAPYIPNGSTFIVRTEPLARDSGQILDKPVSLYTLTEPFTFDHSAKNWTKISGEEI